MAATSNHWGDIARWIEQSIESGTSRQHNISNLRLIHLLLDRMNERNVDFTTIQTLRRQLLNKLNSHYTTYI